MQVHDSLGPAPPPNRRHQMRRDNIIKQQAECEIDAAAAATGLRQGSRSSMLADRPAEKVDVDAKGGLSSVNEEKNVDSKDAEGRFHEYSHAGHTILDWFMLSVHPWSRFR
jgi:hypothetical protein